ncbi:MAG: aminoglycoside phosphotransferase family protein [Thermoplasmata archaeon]|nr:aminoglycoside phosphotransferase family protein [Thermoplasmata archaeon]
MPQDLTLLDSPGWDALRKALNQRVVVINERLIPSKRNRVWVVETDVRPVIMKRSLSGRAEREFANLARARQAGLDVPFPLHRSDDYMVIEFLQGERCDSLINHMFSVEAAENLAIWLARFHERMGDGGKPTIMADAELTNFLFCEGRVFGVDLEDVVEGDPMEDIGRLLASILGSEPIFTPVKFDLCMRLLDAYEKESGAEAQESVRPFVARHLRLSATTKPLFRKTLLDAAKRLEFDGWPMLA